MKQSLLLMSMLVAGATVAGPQAEGATAASAGRKSGDRWGVIETAPLRGLAGDPALRLELIPSRRLGVGAGWAALSGDRGDVNVPFRRESTEIEGLYYPTLPGGLPLQLFLGLGLNREEAWIGRTQPRDAVTWSRTRGERGEDSWTDHDTYLSTTQTVGLRTTQGWVTAAFRYQRDELLRSDRSVESEDVRSQSYDPATVGAAARSRVTGRFMLHAGIMLR